MEKITAIDNYYLPAGDLQASRHFYEHILGLPLKFEFPQKGLLAFHVGEDEPAIILKDKQFFPEAQPAILLQVTDVRKLHEQLMEAGVTFLKAPYRIQTGWAADLIDPAGNHIGITDYNTSV